MTKLEAFMKKDPSVAQRILDAICAGGWCTHCPGNTEREACMFADTHWSAEEKIRYMLREEEPSVQQTQIIRCKDCKYAVLTSNSEVKYCKNWQADEDGSYGGDPLYLDGDFFCASAEAKMEEGE